MKSILSGISGSTPAFLWTPLLGVSLSTPSLSVCVWSWVSLLQAPYSWVLFFSPSCYSAFWFVSSVSLHCGWLFIYEDLLQPFDLLFSGCSASRCFSPCDSVCCFSLAALYAFFCSLFFYVMRLSSIFVLWLPLGLCKMSHTYNSHFSFDYLFHRM